LLPSQVTILIQPKVTSLKGLSLFLSTTATKEFGHPHGQHLYLHLRLAEVFPQEQIIEHFMLYGDQNLHTVLPTF
ncbi:chlamydia polymorphic membrane middle domain protein, partial [Chlamydia psittaci C1/97]